MKTGPSGPEPLQPPGFNASHKPTSGSTLVGPRDPQELPPKVVLHVLRAKA